MVDSVTDLNVRMEAEGGFFGFGEEVVGNDYGDVEDATERERLIGEESSLRAALARTRFLRSKIIQFGRLGDNLYNVEQISSYEASGVASGLEQALFLLSEDSLDTNLQPLEGGFDADTYERFAENLQRSMEVPQGSDGNIPIDFVFFGDLIEAALRTGNLVDTTSAQGSAGVGGGFSLEYGVNEGYLNRENVRLVLGSFQYTHPWYNTQHTIEMADIPVSLELFAKWFLEKIIVPQKTRYPLRNFIKDVFDQLISPALGSECVSSPDVENLRNDFRIQAHIYSSSDGRSENFRRLSRAKLSDIPRNFALVDHSSAHHRDYWHYMVFQAEEPDPLFIMRRDYGEPERSIPEIIQEDFDDGIYHLNVGNDRGLLKSVKFNRADQKYFLEARLESTGELGSLEQLRERYNAGVTLYGNACFLPGMHVFINPTMVGIEDRNSLRSLARTLGIGGYFMIVQVENIIESGMYETLLDARWTHHGFGFEAGAVRQDICDVYEPSRFAEQILGPINPEDYIVLEGATPDVGGNATEVYIPPGANMRVNPETGYPESLGATEME